MKTSKIPPPIYQVIKKHFPVSWDRGLVITYGDTVYCKYDLTPDLVVHEQTHIKQQLEYGVEKWWDRYLTDKKFRLSQETEAYLNQAKYIRENYTAPQVHIYSLAHDMATYYNKMISLEDAVNVLNSY